MDQKLFKALTVIMPVLDDYQADNIQDDTVGLYEDREFTAAYTTLKTEIQKERVRQAAPELLDALMDSVAELNQYTNGIDENEVPTLFRAIGYSMSAIAKATSQQ